MYSINSFTGSDLPDKTLCITFDDGPGIHTNAIGKFLFEEGLKATFFVVGKYAYEHPDVLQSLKEHHDFIGGNVQDQIIRTDLLIKKFINSNIIYLRSPYGKWSVEVAADLNSNIMATLNHIGPIYWDIGGVDCYYWQLNRSVADAVSAYYKEISAKNKGIIVFHDDIADMDYVKPQNKTLQLLQLLIPRLKAEGYKFVSLEEIASIKKASEEKQFFYLKFKKNKYISLNKNNVTNVNYTSKKDKLAEFSIKMLADGKVVIQSTNNLYFNVEELQDNRVLANKNEIDINCLFDLIPVNNNRIVLRATNGKYLTVDKKLGLVANVPYMRKSQIFLCYLINELTNTYVPLNERILLAKKRLLYIKQKTTALNT